MQVKIEKKFEVKEAIEKVWALLSDPTKVVSSVPGAKITEKVDDRTYKGSISVKVGPTVTDYKGEVHILNLDPVSHRMEIEGKGQDVRGKGSASMKMTGELIAAPDGATEVTTTSEVSIVGLLAQFGGRMINDVSGKIFEEFTKSFRAQLAEIPDSASATGLASQAAQAQAGSVAGGQRGPVAQGHAGPAAERQAGTETEGQSDPAGAATPGDSARAAPTPPVQREPEPIKVLPILFTALRDAFLRFIRRIFGRSTKT